MIKELRDIRYRDKRNREGTASFLLDLYLPESPKSPFPTILFLHGGGLESCSYKDCADLGRFLAVTGIGLAASEYRMYPRAKFPDFIEDAADAINWLYENIGNYGGNPQRIFVGGHSAGAYIAAMLGLDRQYLESKKLPPEIPAGIIPVSGQMITHFAVRREHGQDENKAIIDQAAPIFHVHKTAPPFLNLCADGDIPGRPEENRYFIAMLRSTGHENCEYREIPGRDHGSIFDAIPKHPDDPAAQAILEFILNN